VYTSPSTVDSTTLTTHPVPFGFAADFESAADSLGPEVAVVVVVAKTKLLLTIVMVVVSLA
jgi:hypothetical protein